ncbi:N6-L-threonylcarbamoyladenine synthase [Caldicellulosiruptor bescii]|uniref:tRNA N6-adenosine threonylcarbamoyltransferase n=2 Tax=Caldicellulosiruptor bescii TaxID=31899 RepID=TSAD_CALBD|nr:tRNA (adenosine(37)-N6)-threonylcarbamoyltransferase complex transferase subunit TsaD [Caldicellulosiruptor bescii]B9MKR8.1 RecName: Full=tRNA N6-adenosine threonylcarbamoyltransferase; AltName: Full=N6-L-threonylcarbamoyladenine synthase; Short=t(6)A synthase; AltName: Full=t(6)A37 threonylcarbamoyladenosine biosynthesis protein TsaD; AltName: Full=tRNA threonylcarbamoyladenosine biosynthesis protein TsaD [Caldicellulosiruptor bescii DSM 6725]ACM60926.1 metalloendopeptidase, glycoprotease fam
MLVLGIETSCDETSAAIVEDGRKILSNVIYSQIDIHYQFGGVVPEIASRKHVEKISYVVDMAFKQAGLTIDDIDGIAATYGPGLVGSLLVGLSFAKALSYAKRLPFVAVNHIEGHIYANFITYPQLTPPLIVLVVSGGHTNLIILKDFEEYEVVGKTRDDAAGEAFDKIARYLGLGYPGGPAIDKIAKQGDEDKYKYPVADVGGYNFSFSGLKSAVINHVHGLWQRGEEFKIEDVAASFQKTVVSILVEKTINLSLETNIRKIAVAGGVAANSKLRSEFYKKCAEHNIEFFVPEFKYCTDNAAMIASCGYFKLQKGIVSSYRENAVPYINLVSKKS